MFHRSFEYIVISTIMQETIISNDLVSVRYSFFHPDWNSKQMHKRNKLQIFFFKFKHILFFFLVFFYIFHPEAF